jgi:hypothetical protein
LIGRPEPPRPQYARPHLPSDRKKQTTTSTMIPKVCLTQHPPRFVEKWPPTEQNFTRFAIFDNSFLSRTPVISVDDGRGKRREKTPKHGISIN